MSDKPRYFCNIHGFQDGTKWMRVDPDGRVFGVAQDGREWIAWNYPLDSILGKVADGVWEELPAPAAALVERAKQEPPQILQDWWAWCNQHPRALDTVAKRPSEVIDHLWELLQAKERG